MVADTYQFMVATKPRGAKARCHRWITETQIFNVTSDRGAEKLLNAAVERFPDGSVAPGK